MALTHGSLFSGIEGFGEAFRREGIELAWSVEIEKDCQRIHRRHFPGVPIFDDVCEVGAHNLTPVDIITFGSPCQDLSHAGKRKGFHGQRSVLFFEAARIIDELKPALALWENVSGAFTSNHGRDFAAVLATLRELGASDIAWRVLDAQYHNVPQRRCRVFLVADFRGTRAGQVLFDAESSEGHFVPRPKTRKSPAAQVAGSARVPGDDGAIGTLTQWDLGHKTSGDGAGSGFLIPILEAGARQGKGDSKQDGLGIGEEGDPMFTLQSSKQHAIAFEQPVEAYQCHGSNVGPMGTLRAGNGNEHGGVPFIATDADAPSSLTPWDHQSKRVHRSDGNIPSLQSGERSGQLQPAVFISDDDSAEDGEAMRPPDREATNGAQEDGPFAFAWQQGDDSKHGKDGRGRSWVTRAGDYTGSLSATRVDAVCIPEQASDTTHALTSEGADASEDGTGRGTPLCFDSHASWHLGAEDDLSLTIKSAPGGNGGTPPAIVYEEDQVAGSTTTRYGKGVSSTVDDGAVVYDVSLRGREGGNTAEVSEGVSSALRASQGGSDKAHVLYDAVSVAENQRGEINCADVSQSLNGGGGKPGQGYAAAMTRYGVRRLTPRECERLQGFPDDWTAFDDTGKAVSDAARYRMIGNAVAVPVAQWLARRMVLAMESES